MYNPVHGAKHFTAIALLGVVISFAEVILTGVGMAPAAYPAVNADAAK